MAGKYVKEKIDLWEKGFAFGELKTFEHVLEIYEDFYSSVSWKSSQRERFLRYLKRRIRELKK